MKRLGLTALVLAFLILVTVGTLSFLNWRKFRDAAETVASARRSLRLNTDLLFCLQDAETSQRGFLLTGREEYLARYEGAIENALHLAADLAGSLRGDARNAGRVKTLRTLGARKLDSLERAVQLRKTKGLASALQFLQTGEDERLMDQIRNVANRIDADLWVRREASWEELETHAYTTRWMALIGTFVLAGLVIAGTFALSRAEETQRSLAAAAAASRDLLHITLYSIGDAVITTDREGRVQMLNPVAERLTGYSEKEAQGLPAEQVFHIVNERTRQEVESPIHKVLREGKVVGLANHTALISRSGAEYPIDDSGAPIAGQGSEPAGVVLVFRDVTERKLADDALQQSERRFRTLADSAPVMIWSETAAGERDYFNQPWLKFRGRTVEEEAGRQWREGIHPEDLHRHEELLRAAFDARAPYSLEYRLRNAAGDYVHVLSRGVPRFDNRGEFLGYIGTCVDIEETKRAEEKLRQAAKLESLGVLAGGIAHDFNNLLVGIVGGASLLEDHIPRNSPAWELLESIEQAGDRAAQLTRQMLAYSGQGKFVIEPVNLSAQARQIATLIRASIPKLVELRLQLDAALPPVEADASQIDQVILNLVINGAEAIGPEGGRVEVSTGSRMVQPHEGLKSPAGEDLAPGRYVTLRVADTGSGMDPETLSKIFDPFFSTKFTGRGLGLAAVQGIVRGHDGAIKVESEPGRGTVFEIYLPAAAVRAETPERASNVELAGSGKALVVDDEETVQRVAGAALERAGYTVLVAGSGQEAVDLFGRESESVTLIVLDMAMPGIGGEETLQRLRRIRSNVPVLISSGFSEEEVRLKFGDAGYGFLRIPYTVNELAKAVRSALAERGGNAQSG